MSLEPFQIESPVFEDNRGCFAPVKLFGDWVQSNISISDNLFTFRGLHLQQGKHAQTKKLSVIRGKIVDFCVDFCEDSLILFCISLFTHPPALIAF